MMITWKQILTLTHRCTKPDRKEFTKIAIATAIGFALMVRYSWCLAPCPLSYLEALLRDILLCVSGLHRLLCEADPHPHQQHHCGGLVASADILDLHPDVENQSC